MTEKGFVGGVLVSVVFQEAVDLWEFYQNTNCSNLEYCFSTDFNIIWGVSKMALPYKCSFCKNCQFGFLFREKIVI